ncbi:MAG: hypothetical protein ACLTPN_02775 [Clostridia bacterium]
MIYMSITEKEINKIIRNNFNSNNVLVELEGIVQGKFNFIKASCSYNHKNGILYILDLLNSIKIDIASQYKIIYEQNSEILKIYLDNSQDLKISVIKRKGTL